MFMKKWFRLIVIIALFSLAIISITGYASDIQSTKVGDIRMEYMMIGEGYPLVMIMGFRGTMDIWDQNVLNILSSHYRLIIFNNRGMGETEAGIRQFTIEQFADDTAGLMEALGIERAHVLGYSMGTEVAQELVLRHPRKVNKLILYAADCGGYYFPTPPEVEKKLYDTSGTNEERGKRLVGLLFPDGWLAVHLDYVKDIFSRSRQIAHPENVKQQADAMNNWKGCCDRLHQIKSPTLLVTGTEDILTLPGYSYMMVDKILGAKLVKMENGGHGVMYQFPERFSEAVIDFLR